MAAVLKRLLTLGAALAFLVGVTAQLLPPGMANTQMAARADMAGGCAGPQPPCSDEMPDCIDHIGCVIVSVLPTAPLSIPVAFEWTSLDYAFLPEPLSGISVKPELSPPILAA